LSSWTCHTRRETEPSRTSRDPEVTHQPEPKRHPSIGARHSAAGRIRHTWSDGAKHAYVPLPSDPELAEFEASATAVVAHWSDPDRSGGAVADSRVDPAARSPRRSPTCPFSIRSARASRGSSNLWRACW
jgi:hypothetical protein